MQVVNANIPKGCDSIASNTASIKEACVLLNQNLKTNRTYKYCRNLPMKWLLIYLRMRAWIRRQNLKAVIFKRFGHSLTIIRICLNIPLKLIINLS